MAIEQKRVALDSVGKDARAAIHQRRSGWRVFKAFEQMELLNARLEEVLSKLSELSPSIEAEVGNGDSRPLANLTERGIFIVGHARSGTSILTDALNSSPDVYCLSEANFHQSVVREDFAVWYNQMHRRLENPPQRSTRIPVIAGNGWDVLTELSKNYRYVGEKVAFRQETLGYDFCSFYEFSARHFPRSHYLCIFREPERVITSNIDMFFRGELTPEHASAIAISQLQTYYLILSLYLTLPNVYLLVHERIDAQTFDRLGSVLSSDFSKSAPCYNQGPKPVKQGLETLFQGFGTIARTRHYYNRIVDAVNPVTLVSRVRQELRRMHYDLHDDLKRMDSLPRGWR